MTNIDFGHEWCLPSGKRALLCWHRLSGELVLHRPDQQANDILAVIPDETDLRARLQGWEHHCFTINGLKWLTEQLDGVR